MGWNGSKDTVESALNLDIFDLQRKGFLKVAAGVPSEIQWTNNGRPCGGVGYVLAKREGIPVSMRLQYKITNGDEKISDYWVWITSTSCN